MPSGPGPKKHLHSCSGCGHDQLLDKEYPYYEEIEGIAPYQMDKDENFILPEKKKRKG
jgi:hypothetical protein